MLIGSGNQGLLFSSYWEGGTTVPQIIDGGKINVRSNGNGQIVAVEDQNVDPIAQVLTPAVEETESFVAEEGNNYLLPNKPNPFNNSTSITVIVEQYAKITLTVYNSVGEVIEVLNDGMLAPGRYEFSFKPANLPDGIYFYSMTDGKSVETKRMVFIR